MAKIEDYFGAKAGIVWQALSKNGALNIARLKRETRLSETEVYAALGWLAREGKIEIVGIKPLFYKFALKV
jgi:hypothetical protein